MKARAQPWTKRRAPVFAGQHDTNLKTGEDYATRPLGSIFAMAPTCRPKMAGFAFLPSTYHDFDARCHRVQRERGGFLALCGDIDKGNHPLARIEALAALFAGTSAWLIYSSAHARPEDKRWRVIFPLAEIATFADWFDAQLAMFAFLESAGVAVDRALKGAGQPVFLPNVPRFHGKTGQALRGADGAPLHYACATSGIDRPGLDLHSGPVAIGMAAIRRKRADDEREREHIREEAAARQARQPISTLGKIISEFDRANPITTLLKKYRYDQSPRNPADWRSPHQASDSYATRVDGHKWVSLSGSDADAGLGRQCDAGRHGDAYDLFVHYEHRGDHKAAFRSLHAERRFAA